jgi:hypothetical protein
MFAEASLLEPLESRAGGESAKGVKDHDYDDRYEQESEEEEEEEERAPVAGRKRKRASNRECILKCFFDPDSGERVGTKTWQSGRALR